MKKNKQGKGDPDGDEGGLQFSIGQRRKGGRWRPGGGERMSHANISGEKLFKHRNSKCQGLKAGELLACSLYSNSPGVAGVGGQGEKMDHKGAVSPERD